MVKNNLSALPEELQELLGRRGKLTAEDIWELINYYLAHPDETEANLLPHLLQLLSLRQADDDAPDNEAPDADEADKYAPTTGYFSQVNLDLDFIDLDFIEPLTPEELGRLKEPDAVLEGRGLSQARLMEQLLEDCGDDEAAAERLQQYMRKYLE